MARSKAAAGGVTDISRVIDDGAWSTYQIAAVFIAIAAVLEPAALLRETAGNTIPPGNRLELFLGAAIGAITFSGSVIAWGKLSGSSKFRLFQGAPVMFAGQHAFNLALGLATVSA